MHGVVSPLTNMFSPADIETTYKRNTRKLRELISISFTLGVNITAPSRFKDSLKVWNVILTVSSIISLYGHWYPISLYTDNIPRIAESIFTALQTLISIVKMIYYFLRQRHLYNLMHTAQTHELLWTSELFNKDFPILKDLKAEVEKIMEDQWRFTRRQLLYYTGCCTGIVGNYVFVAIFWNLYHAVKGTPDMEYKFPYPITYPEWIHHNMAFPYFHTIFFLSLCAVYISGACAVSFDGVFIVLCLHCVGLLKSLNLMILASTSPQLPREQRVDYMRCCIYQYQQISEYVNEINQTYMHLTISQFVLSLVVLGISTYQMSIGLEDRATFLRMLLYIMAASYEVILYCWNGESLRSASEETSAAIFSCDWYNESREFKQLTHMMLQRSNRIFSFNISWFSIMCLPTLMAFAKTSASYFLLLRNVTE